MPKKSKSEKIKLSKKASKILEAFRQITRFKPEEIASEIIESFANKYAENSGIAEKAIDLYISEKIDFETLKLIVGPEKANAAKITKRLRKKTKELLDTISK